MHLNGQYQVITNSPLKKLVSSVCSADDENEKDTDDGNKKRSTIQHS